jgi:hypothetical protein
LSEIRISTNEKTPKTLGFRGSVVCGVGDTGLEPEGPRAANSLPNHLDEILAVASAVAITRLPTRTVRILQELGYLKSAP